MGDPEVTNIPGRSIFSYKDGSQANADSDRKIEDHGCNGDQVD